MQCESTDYSSNTRLVNPFEQEGHWYKANLHTHTTTSDGDASVSERVRQYREHGYSILAITDHGKTNDVAGFSTEDFLVLGGLETHPDCKGGGNVYHLVCLNVPVDITFPEGADPNTRIEIVKRAGGEVIFAHPYWCGHNINHLLEVRGYIGIEVYNATCTKIGKGISSVHWDDLLDTGKVVPAIASDDTHSGRDIFMGWTMIKARRLTVDAVMEAVRTGCYYSSCGPTIEDFRVDGGRVILSCSPVVEVHFMCRRANGKSIYAEGKNAITNAEFPCVSGNPPDDGLGYVRVEIVDQSGRRAWTNPIFLDGRDGSI